MEARKIIDNAPLGPDARRAVGQAFDEAWERVADKFVEGESELARIKLARAVLLARAHSHDAYLLKEIALRLMSNYYRILWLSRN